MRTNPAITCLLLCACTPDPADTGFGPAGGVIFVADSLEQERVLVLGTPSGELLLEIRFDEVDPEHCRSTNEGQEVWCLPYEVEYQVGDDGLDRLLAMYSPYLFFEHGHYTLLPGVLSSFLLTPAPELEWSVDRLDLSGVTLDPGGEVCQADPDDPCNTEGVSDEEMFPCTMRKPHGFSVLEEDDGSLRATVTDSRNHRILELEIDKGERCATVHRSISAHTLPEWTVYDNPNDVETWIEGDSVHTLVSFKGSDPDTAEQGAAGRGKIVHLAWEGGGEPTIPWVFPPYEESEPSFLNGQHNVDLLETEAGERLMMVAHSGGASEWWHNDAPPGEEHGTVLLTSCCDEQPRYLLDVTLTDTTLGYLRDVDLIDGGRALLTDSGCIEPEGCPVGAQLLEIPLPDLDALDQLGLPERAGHWSADHAAQNLHEVQTEPWLLPQPWDDLGVSAYEADWVPAADLGERMRTLLEEGT